MLIHGATDVDMHPPRFGGAQRCFGLYRGLARRHQVQVLCMVPNRSRGAREQRADGVAIRRRKAWFTALAWRLERARVSPLFLAAHGHAARVRAMLGELEGTPDVLMTDLSVSAMRDHSGARLKVHHAHNVEYDHFRSAGPALVAKSYWAERLRALEARAVALADLVVAACDEDAARLRALYALPEARVVVAPNGYDETAIRPASPEARVRARAVLGVTGGETVCLFVGSDVPHNRAGLALLVRQVMPALAEEGFRLLVVGRVRGALAGGREPWLIAHGEAADLADSLAAADVGLNPVLGGGGSNIKLPTYLAAGLPVVTTPHGLRGFAPLRGSVVVAEAAAMADALRSRPAGWARTGGGTPVPPAALADYAWGRIGERLGEAFASRLAASGSGQGVGGVARARLAGAAADEAGRKRA